MSHHQKISEAIRNPEAKTTFSPNLVYYWDNRVDEYTKRGFDGLVDYTNDVLGGDALLRGYKPCYEIVYDFPVEEKWSEETQTKTITYKMPVGDLVAVYKYSKDANSTALISHPIEDEEDLEKLIYLLKHTEIKYSSEVDEFVEKYGENAFVVGLIGFGMKTATQNMIEHWCGIENFSYLLMDEEELVEEAISLMKVLNMKTVECATKCKAEYFISWEDSTELLTSPTWYEKYIATELNEWCDVLHAHGKKYMLHACGHLNSLIPIIAKTKIDAIESITPFPTGNADLKQVAEVFPKNIAIIGGLDPVVLMKGDKDEIKDRVLDLIETFKDRPLIVANSDSLPPQVTEETLKYVAELVKSANEI